MTTDDLRTEDGLAGWADTLFERVGSKIPEKGPPGPCALVMVTRSPETREPLAKPGLLVITAEPPPGYSSSAAKVVLHQLRDSARKAARELDAVGVAVLCMAYRQDRNRWGLVLQVEHRLLGKRCWMAEGREDGTVGPRRDPWEGFELREPLVRFLPSAYMD